MEAKIPYLEGYEVGKKAGMKKVVEELRLRGDMSMNFPFSNVRKESWQDMLKELDIEEGQ